MERKKRQEHLRRMVAAAALGSMICVMTAFIKIPTHQGYIHVGDGIVFLAASLLPAPYAMLCSAVGAGLADYLSGYPLWILPTIIIKAMMTLAFTHKRSKIICRRNLAALIPASVICIGGYYLAAVLLYGSWMTALIDIPSNLIQSTAGAGVFVFLGASLDRVNFKGRRLITL